VLSGIIAFQEGWIRQLYVHPSAQGRGIGTELLGVAKEAFGRLELWTFQRNARARRFYEARGFVLAEETDGTRNEEKEPDARYLWTRSGR
jgi:GNAT superfamily N-acetyltransferase